MKTQELDLNRDHGIFGYSFAYLGDPRTETEEYKLLMKIANNNGLMTTFQSMLYKHIKEHQNPDGCLYCLLAILW